MPKRAKKAARNEVDNRFVSPEAQELFDKVFCKKKPVQERGFRQDWANHDLGEQLEQIWNARRWSSFVTQPPPGVISVVREFYANLDETCRSSKVRGVMVRAEPSYINSLLNLPTVQEDDYMTNLQTLDHLTVSEFLCPTGTQWKYEAGLPRSFPKQHMIGMGKVWLYFISARLLPTTHLADVTKERAYMIYTILTGGRFDVGRHISMEIYKLMRGVRGGLWFPSLITQLCQRAGVPMGSDEELCYPKGVLDRSLILRISAANFPDAQRDNVVPRHVPMRDRRTVEREQDLRERTEAIQYMHHNFTTMDGLLRDIASHLQIDTSRHQLTPPPAWSIVETEEEESEEEDTDVDA